MKNEKVKEKPGNGEVGGSESRQTAITFSFLISHF
jgi:hypothetical protein